MSATCFELQASFSGRRLYIQVPYNLFTCKGTSSLVGGRLLVPLNVNNLYDTCTYNRLPEDEPSSLKHVEDIVKLKIAER